MKKSKIVEKKSNFHVKNQEKEKERKNRENKRKSPQN